MLSNPQKGVSLVITFFIMVIISAIVLFVSSLLYSEIKIIRNMSASMTALFAGDSGVEKVLYYDRQVIPELADGSGTSTIRGLCSMFDAVNNQERYCQSTGPGPDYSIYCDNKVGPVTYDDVSNPLYDSSRYNPNGCDPGMCDDCELSFDTKFYGATYKTTARIYPVLGGDNSYVFEVESKGSFKGVSRQIKIMVNSEKLQDAIIIENACATPLSSPQGYSINISADVYATAAGADIATVTADIYYFDSIGLRVDLVSDLNLNAPAEGLNTWTYLWDSQSSAARAYHVNIEAQDNLPSPNVKGLESIAPYPICLTS